MKQNGLVCLPGPTLLFFIFRFQYLISGPKSYRDFRETAPRNGKHPHQLQKHLSPASLEITFLLKNLKKSSRSTLSSLISVSSTLVPISRITWVRAWFPIFEGGYKNGSSIFHPVPKALIRFFRVSWRSRKDVAALFDLGSS